MALYFTKCITFGRAKEGLMASFQRQLMELQKEIGFEYVRFHGLFHDDMAVYDEEEDGTPSYWFGYVDELFDFLLSAGLKPFVELGFMPEKLATVKNTVFWWQANGCPPNSYEKWTGLVRETVLHLVERYGMNEVKTWYFEVWNEPNLGSFFRGTMEEYFRLYQVSEQTIHAISKEFRVGGPSTSGADFREGLSYLRSFIDYCEMNHLPVDFFSAHPYPTYWPLDTDGNQQMGYMKKESTIEHLDMIRDIVDHSAYADAEIHLTEWNSSPSPRDLIHDTPFMAPYLIYNITHNFNKVDSLAFWTFTDIFEENGPGKSPFHGGFGLINVHGIKKPAYWAYWMLSQLGEEILSVDDSSIVTRSGDNYCILVYNYCYYKEEFQKGDRRLLLETDRDHVFEDAVLTKELSLSIEGTFEETEYILNQENSALHNWIAMGAPKYPTNEQIQKLKKISQPIEKKNIVHGFQKKVTLQPHEVRMYLLNAVLQ